MKYLTLCQPRWSASQVAQALHSGVDVLWLRQMLPPELTATEASQYLLSWLDAAVTFRAHTAEADSLVWDIRPRVDQGQSRAQATFSEHQAAAEFHTDSSYLQHPEQYIALYCLQAARCGGGKTLLVSGDELAQLLAFQAPESHRLLHEHALPFHIPDVFLEPEQLPWHYGPVLAHSPFRIRYRQDTLKRGFVQAPLSEHLPRQAVFGAFQTLQRLLLTASPVQMALFLQAGDLLLLNNWRVLHARTAFEDSQRHLLRLRFDLK